MLTALDNHIIEIADRLARSIRGALGLSYPALMAWSGLLVFPVICLGIFLSYSNTLFVKAPLLLMGAFIAATTVRRLFDDYARADAYWSPEREAAFRMAIQRTRTRLRPARFVLGILTLIQIAVTAVVSMVGVMHGASPADLILRIVFPCLFGLPTVFAYHYLICVDPGDRTWAT
jgi:hypothetical protein